MIFISRPQRLAKILFEILLMNTLFPVEPAYPEGFLYTSDFVGPHEEIRHYKEIQKIELPNLTFQVFAANRKVASFGYNYNFENGSLTRGKNSISI